MLQSDAESIAGRLKPRNLVPGRRKRHTCLEGMDKGPHRRGPEGENVLNAREHERELANTIRRQRRARNCWHRRILWGAEVFAPQLGVKEERGIAGDSKNLVRGLAPFRKCVPQHLERFNIPNHNIPHQLREWRFNALQLSEQTRVDPRGVKGACRVLPITGDNPEELPDVPPQRSRRPDERPPSLAGRPRTRSNVA